MAKIFYLLKQNKNQGSKIFGKWETEQEPGF